MWLGFDVCGINEWIVKILVTFVVLVYNYLSRKFIIFTDKKGENSGNVNQNLINLETETSIQETKTEEISETKNN